MKDAWREINAFLGRYLSPAVRVILIVNVALFVLYVLLTPFLRMAEVFFFLLMQTPALVLRQFFLWQLVTYMFMHASFGHLFFNMLILWFFAPRLEYRWGTARFVRFYLTVGAGAGLFHLLVAFIPPGHPDSTMLGASGALYGLMLAYALNWPDDLVLVYFVLPIKIKYLMIILALFTFLFSLPGSQAGGISHVTHLGGFLVALVYLKGGQWFGGRPKRRRRKARVLEVDPRRHPDFR